MDSIKDLQAIITELEKSVSLNQVAKMSGMNYITLRNIKFARSKNVTESVAARLRAFASTFTPPADAPAKPRGGRKKGVAAPAPAVKKSDKTAKKNAVKKSAVKAAKKSEEPKSVVMPNPFDASNVPAKKRGRPKKVVGVTPAPVAPVAAVTEAAAPVAKKRGRPKKNVATTPVAASAAAAPAAAAPVAKKRGRPRKNAAVAPAVATAAPKKVAPKKAAPKKRGRKPGSVVKSTAAPAATEFTSLVMMADLKRQIELAEARLAYLRSLEKAEAEFIAKMGGKK